MCVENLSVQQWSGVGRGGAAVSGADSESRIKVAISNCYNKPSAVIKERRKKKIAQSKSQP